MCIAFQQKTRMRTAKIFLKSTDLYLSILRMIVFMPINKCISEQ